MLKKMKVGTRVLFGFLIAIILTIVLGAVSIIGSNMMSGKINGLYDGPYAAQQEIATIKVDINQATQYIYGAMMTSDQAQLEDVKKMVESKNTEMMAASAKLKEIYPEAASTVDSFESIVGEAAPLINQMLESQSKGDTQSALQMMSNQFTPLLDKALGVINQMQDTINTEASTFKADADQMAFVVLIAIIALIVVEVVVAMLLAIAITRSIRKPIEECANATTEIAKGNLDVGVGYSSNDELGTLSGNINSMVGTLKSYIGEISDVLSEMADGNLAVETKENYLGDFTQIGESLNKMILSLNATFESMDQSAGQVAIGSNEVSRGAQALAQGATEQSSSVQELSASINQISDQVQRNADNAKETQGLIKETADQVGACNVHMQGMLESMDAIDKSSSEIAKIIKVIDDISFQTNILALNAAVEAARAGSAGMGFAVVADEVRNLATKSAEAAKETSALIEGSVQKVQIGNKNALDTADVLKSIVESSVKISQNIDDIANSSDEQARAIGEVNQGVEQISTVVQTNSATAQQSAAASQELSGQADMMKQMVSRFRLKNQSVDSINMYDSGSYSDGMDDSMDFSGEKY